MEIYEPGNRGHAVQCLGALAYSNSFAGRFIFDDRVILEDASIRQLWPPWTAMLSPNNIARPVVGLTFAINPVYLGGDKMARRVRSELEDAQLRCSILFRKPMKNSTFLRTGCSWFFWRGQFGPGNKPCSLPSQRRCSSGIASRIFLPGPLPSIRGREARCHDRVL